MAIAARIPMIRMTTVISVNANPARRRRAGEVTTLVVTENSVAHLATGDPVTNPKLGAGGPSAPRALNSYGSM